MKNNIRKLTAEIENLCTILQHYCNANSETQEMQNVITLINCIDNKVEELYMLTNENSIKI